ncbi:MAG TPA: glycosyltransferase, partial [Acidimicrobiales bacterium]|nr:glycosyltransferase [Acidimicrobiales bacterium]
RAGPDPGACLTVVGAPSEPHYASALRRYAAELGLGASVAFRSGLREAELSAHYAAADVLVMLSEHEGFGVPLVEAMAHGLPVVAYRSGAVEETAADAAVLVDDRRPRRVAGAVTRLLADPECCERLRAAGRRRLAELDLGSAADRFVDLVLDLAGARPTA